MSLPGVVQRTCEHAVQPFYGRAGPCLRVAERQELLDYGGKVFDHFRNEMKQRDCSTTGPLHFYVTGRVGIQTR